jgi:hypothetical protein
MEKLQVGAVYNRSRVCQYHRTVYSCGNVAPRSLMHVRVLRDLLLGRFLLCHVRAELFLSAGHCRAGVLGGFDAAR